MGSLTSTTTLGPQDPAPRANRGAGPDLEQLSPLLRPAGTVCSGERLGAARMTRHSFAPAFLRHAADQRWRVERERWELDDLGHGEAVYRLTLGHHVLRFVVFSTTIPDEHRADRVVSVCWDVTAALIEGEFGDERMAELRQQVPLQEAGRADADTLIWTRANRSQRFFDYVAERLAAGRQPEFDVVGPCAYVLRSTAFYGNGKFGMAPFAALRAPHPLAVPFRAQMLAAFVLREFSYDLVEHRARAIDPAAVRLSGDWGRYLGLGNATGLGMVPFFANHPAIFDAWCRVRELALANARFTQLAPSDPQVARLQGLGRRVCNYLDERSVLATAPFAPYAEVAADLRLVMEQVETFAREGTIGGVPPDAPWDRLWRWAADEVGIEAQELLVGLLTELDDALDGQLEALLTVDESTDCRPRHRVSDLAELIEERFGWIDELDVDDPGTAHWSWYYSADSEEPRRAPRDAQLAGFHEMPIDIPRQIHRLRTLLGAWSPDTSVAELLLVHPEHRGAIERLQSFGHLDYSEVHDDLLAESFLPLQIQRFKLANYGMTNYVPQSTDWVRVVLMQGAPRAAEIADGELIDWIYPLDPDREVTP
jgi:hypothetical protein